MSLAPIESGEVTVLDPVDFLQFAGIGGAARGVSAIAVKTGSKLGQQLLKQVAEQFPKNSQKELAPFGSGILNSVKNIFSKPVTKAVAGGGAIAGTVAATTIPKQVTQVVTSKGISVIDKALIGAGLTTVTAGLVTLTPGGQNLVTQAGNTTNQALGIGQDISQFIKANGQIISIVLLLGGAALLIGAIRK